MGNPVREYWDKKIRIWSETSYEKTPQAGLSNKFFSKVRSSVDARMHTALEVFQPYVEGKTILDLGCGVGLLGFALIEMGCERYVGIDISQVAVDEAAAMARGKSLGGKMEFRCANLLSLESFPEADITVGLGMLDWFNLDDVERIIEKLRGRKIVLTFSEQDNSLSEIIHRFYLVKRLQWQNKGVYAYHFRRVEIDTLLARQGFENVKYIKNRQMRFGVLFHNLNEK